MFDLQKNMFLLLSGVFFGINFFTGGYINGGFFTGTFLTAAFYPGINISCRICFFFIPEGGITKIPPDLTRISIYGNCSKLVGKAKKVNFSSFFSVIGFQNALKHV